jgi:hypothetical protein
MQNTIRWRFLDQLLLYVLTSYLLSGKADANLEGTEMCTVFPQIVSPLNSSHLRIVSTA